MALTFDELRTSAYDAYETVRGDHYSLSASSSLNAVTSQRGEPDGRYEWVTTFPEGIPLSDTAVQALAHSTYSALQAELEGTGVSVGQPQVDVARRMYRIPLVTEDAQ